jgi:hypothetical protein
MKPDVNKEYKQFVIKELLPYCKNQLPRDERKKVMVKPDDEINSLQPLQQTFFHCKRYLVHHDLYNMGEQTKDKLDRKDKFKSRILDCWNKEATVYNEIIVARWPDGPQADVDGLKIKSWLRVCTLLS